MADPFSQAITLGGVITASAHNDAWDNLETYLNQGLGAATSGQLLVANSSGVVVPRTMTGQGEVSNTGVFSLNLTPQSASPSGNATLGAEADVAGATLNVSAAGDYLAFVNAGVTISGDTDSATVYLNVDGSNETRNLPSEPKGGTGGNPAKDQMSGLWYLTNLSASDTIKLRASGSSANALLIAAQTQLIVVKIGP